MIFLEFAIDETSRAVGFALATFRASEERKFLSKEPITLNPNGGDRVAPSGGPMMESAKYLSLMVCATTIARPFTVCVFALMVLDT